MVLNYFISHIWNMKLLIHVSYNTEQLWLEVIIKMHLLKEKQKQANNLSHLLEFITALSGLPLISSHVTTRLSAGLFMHLKYFRYLLMS